MTFSIGIDFDNTIICYDAVFLDLARAEGLVPPDFRGNKNEVRDAIRLLADGDTRWQKLQGQVYGAQIGGATLFPGVDHFLRHCGQIADATVYIVSHKTEFGHFDSARINLRKAARAWMTKQAFFDRQGYGLSGGNLYFETSRDDKIDRIARLNCTHFIDDLEEVLDHPRFPPQVQRILFANDRAETKVADYPVCADWRAIEEQVFGHAH